MNNTEKSFINKVCAILIIIALTITDFLFVGTTFVSYAVGGNKTSNPNVEFSAYFLNQDGEKVEALNKYIGSEEYLYIDVSVKNEGYLNNGKITLDNCNFKVKKVLSDGVSEITDNTINLNQIKAGSTVTIKLAIEAIKNDVISSANLNSESTVTLSGKYINSKNIENGKNEDISVNDTVTMKWISDENTGAILNTSVITNYTYNDEQVIQVLIESNISDNNYPVKSTEINVTVPENVKDVKVHSRENNATNSNVNFDEKNYTYNADNKTLTINVANDNENSISWNKNAKDAFVVTFIFEKDAVLENIELTVNSTIITYDNVTLRNTNNWHDLQNSKKTDGIVSFELINKESSIYKGKIYAGQEREYSEINKVNIDYVEPVEKISYTANESDFLADENEVNSNIIYKGAKINKQQFIKIFGENGSITFKDGVQNPTINASSTADENGNINVSFMGDAKNVEVSTSKPVSTGVLTIEYTKAILNSQLNREEINSLTAINESIAGSYNNNEKKNVTSSIELKNTSSKADLTVSTNTLSSTEVNKNVRITAVLLNNDESRDVYKNPVIKIVFPKQVTDITDVRANLMYHNNELEILEPEKNHLEKEDGKLVLKYELNGEQKAYLNEAVEGTTLIIDTNITVDKLATNSNEKITLNYSNEFATVYEDDSKEEVPVQIVTPTGLIVSNNIPELKVEEIGTQGTKNVALDILEKSKDITVEVKAINNVGVTLKNVEVFGKLPTNGNLNLTLKNGITGVENAKIYYTQNEKATADLNNESNAWKEENTGAKLYLIKVDELKAGERIDAKYVINVPENLKYNLSAEESFSVNYTNSVTEEKLTVNSAILNLTTGAGAEIKATVKTSVGEEEVKNNAEVKAGEIIYYNFTVKNEGNADAENLKVETVVPENATFVELNSKYPGKHNDVTQEYDDYSEPYFVESNDKTKVETLNLKQGESKIISYMVRVNKDIKERTSASIKSTVSMNEKTINTEDTKFIFVPANMEIIVRVGNRRIGEPIDSKSSYPYMIDLKNYTDKEIKNAKVYLNIDDSREVVDLTILSETEYFIEPTLNKNDNSFVVDSIKPEDTTYLEMALSMDDKKITDSVKLSAYVVDDQNNKYRSNIITEKVEQEDKVNIKVTETATTSSKNNDKNVAIGDSLNYKITIKNEGTTDLEELTINDYFSDYINLTSMTIDGKEVEYQKTPIFGNNSNYSIITFKTSLKANEEKVIDISAKVDSNIPTEKNLEVINKVEVYNDEKLVGETEKITHNIKLVDEPTGNNGNSGNGEQDPNSQDPNSNDPSSKDPTGNGNNSNDPEKAKGYSISGIAWFDENENGERETSEKTLSNIKVSLINMNENKIVSNTITSENGEYEFTNLDNGNYIAIFEYDTEKYALTTYKAQGVIESRNSDVVNVDITINGEKGKENATDTIVVNDKNVANIDIGLTKAKVFDLKLDKTISKLTISNAEGTKVQEYDNATLAQKQIRAKYISGTTVVVEYKIKVTNVGEAAGYARQIVDHKPNDMVFNSKLNSEWYQSGSELYSTALANTKLEPGESKELTLTLTKKMTETNPGLTHNTAEITESFNSMGIKEKDSVSGNKAKNDTGSADVIISVSTGAAKQYITLTLSLIIAIAAIAYLISKKILKENIKL